MGGGPGMPLQSSSSSSSSSAVESTTTLQVDGRTDGLTKPGRPAGPGRGRLLFSICSIDGEASGEGGGMAIGERPRETGGSPLEHVQI